MVAIFAADAEARAGPTPHGANHELTHRLERALRCTCGSCEPMPLAECGCDFAKEERSWIATMIEERNPSTNEAREEAYREILGAFVEKYGEEAVLHSRPEDTDLFRYGLPIGGGLAFVAILIAIIELMQRRSQSGRTRRKRTRAD